MVAISPQVPAKNAEVKNKQKLSFPVLSDPKNEYANQLSLAFELPDDLKKVYQEFGISLPEFNGDDSWQLPIPARLVVDAAGQIRNVSADPDYTRRPEPGETIEVLSGLTAER